MIDPNANLPALPVALTVDPARPACANCTYAHTNALGRLECWHDPPSVIGQAIVSPPVLPGGPPHIQWIADGTRAPTRPDWTCSLFRPAPQVTN
jgi:hypothetical protein